MKLITGDDLKAIRKYGKRNITELANTLGINRKTFMNWEKGIGTPNINQFLTILRLCEIDSRLYIDQVFSCKPSTAFDIRFINDLCNRKG